MRDRSIVLRSATGRGPSAQKPGPLQPPPPRSRAVENHDRGALPAPSRKRELVPSSAEHRGTSSSSTAPHYPQNGRHDECAAFHETPAPHPLDQPIESFGDGKFPLHRLAQQLPDLRVAFYIDDRGNGLFAPSAAERHDVGRHKVLR